MTVLLRWIEPFEPGKSKREFRPMDWIIGFGLAAVIGLGMVEKSGPTMLVPLGEGSELSLPSQPWQYGVWLLIAIAVGSFGTWIMSLGGHAEVTVREDGINWLLGRALWHFYPYARMERCDLERADGGDYWRLRLTMKPEPPGDSAPVIVLTMPNRIDVRRLRDILQSAGVATSGGQ
jgi:hypothetical protein